MQWMVWSRCGNWVSERLSDFSRTTQLVRSKAGFHLKSQLALPLLAIAKRWVFLSILFCDNPNPHNSTQGGLTIQDVCWAVAHLGQRWAFVQAVPYTWSSSLLSLQLLNPPQPYDSAQDLSPGRRGPLLNVSPTKRPCFPAGRSNQATLSSLSHTDRGCRKCQLSLKRFAPF